MSDNDKKEEKRLSIIMKPSSHERLSEFVEQHKEEFPNISEFVRHIIDLFINNYDIISKLENFQGLSHELKIPLTSIKGFLQLIINKQSQDLDPKILKKINKIMEQTNILEEKINSLFLKDHLANGGQNYDVLIVEDDLSTIEVLDEYFEMEGFKVKGVANGKKALNELDTTVPKLILLDILLPDIDGYIICEKIREKEELKDIPVFYITAVPEEIVRERVKKTNATGYILKPFDLTDLDKIIECIRDN